MEGSWRTMKTYKLKPLYWMSKYLGLGVYSFMEEIRYIERLIEEVEK